jgi:hypothetical protein
MKKIRIFESEERYLKDVPLATYASDLYYLTNGSLTIYHYVGDRLEVTTWQRQTGYIIQIQVEACGRVIPEPLIFW